MNTSDTAETEVARVCTQEGCEAPEGPCLEGIGLDDCPHFKTLPAGQKPEEEPDEAHISLHRGKALRMEEAAAHMAKWDTQVVVLAGEVGVGKTTLLTVVFDKYSRGLYADHVFAGSRTLHGFEERIRTRRVDSWNQEARTDRTPYGAPDRFLHLAVAPENSLDRHKNLLMTDIAGEEFEAVRDHPLEAPLAPVLKRANHVGIAIDAFELADSARRNAPIFDAKQLIRGAAEVGLLDRAQGIQLVLTRLDRAEATKRDEVIEVFEDLARQVEQVIPSVSSQLSTHVTAAKAAADGSFEAGLGVEGLFREWLSPQRSVSVPTIRGRADPKTPYASYSVGSV